VEVGCVQRIREAEVKPKVYKRSGRWWVRIAGIDFYDFATQPEAFASAFESATEARRMVPSLYFGATP